MTTTGQLVPIKVNIDCGDEGRGDDFEVMHDPGVRWNGFVVPHCTREQAEWLFTDAVASGMDIDWHFDVNGALCLIDNPEKADESVTRIHPITGLYILDIGWTFVPAEED